MNIKLGYYEVNGLKFYNKLQAILYANLTKADISWNFNREIFDNTDWKIEPNLSLDSLYRIRSTQIREQFDYVILMCSGGADSTNMLYSFINNNIKVDEIVFGAPLSGLNNWDQNLKDKSANNTVTETFVAQIPLMNQVSQTNPEIKITLHDYFEDILQMKTDSWIYESSAHWIHFSGATRHSLDKFAHIKNLAESGKRIGVVYGIDKPVILRDTEGKLHSVITDPVVNVVTPHFRERYTNVESVLYYYTPDLPELLIKQAHEVCRAIYDPKNSYARSLIWDWTTPLEFQKSAQRVSAYQRSIIPFIYPSMSDRFSVWQADKQGNGFLGGFEIDNWILQKHQGSRIIEMVESDLTLFLSKLDRKYFLSDNKKEGFKRFYLGWEIGHEEIFKKKIDYNILDSIKSTNTVLQS